MPSKEAIEVLVCTGCCCWDTASQRIIRSFVGKYGKQLGDIFTGDCRLEIGHAKVHVKEHRCFGECIKAPLLKIGDNDPVRYESVKDIEAAITAT